MFTGLIQAIGEVASIENTGAGARLRIDPRGWDHTPRPGDSIAVSGCCLTLAEEPRDTWAFDAVAETLAKTTLGLLRQGSRVNLERSLAAGDQMGGHFVQGHVEGVGEVAQVDEADGDYRLTLRPPPDLLPAIVPKGSVTIDGVSLTIAGVDLREGAFAVALIPTTLRLTTLGKLQPASKVNIETDILARTVIHWMQQFGSR